MRTPSSVTTSPSTVTRPAVIISSQARRDPAPAWASTFCRRTPSGSWTSVPGWALTGPGPRRGGWGAGLT